MQKILIFILFLLVSAAVSQHTTNVEVQSPNSAKVTHTYQGSDVKVEGSVTFGQGKPQVGVSITWEH